MLDVEVEETPRPTRPAFVEVRDDDGHLLFLFDPARLLVSIRCRRCGNGMVKLVDLTTFMQPAEAVVHGKAI